MCVFKQLKLSVYVCTCNVCVCVNVCVCAHADRHRRAGQLKAEGIKRGEEDINLKKIKIWSAAFRMESDRHF